MNKKLCLLCGSKACQLIAKGLAVCFIALGLHSASSAKSEPNERKELLVSSGNHHCSIGFKDPYGGWISGNSYAVDDLPYKKTGIGSLAITFVCLSSSDAGSIRDYTLARYDAQKGRWFTDLSGVSARDKKVLVPAVQWLSVKAVGSSGLVVLQRMIVGDPQNRSVSLGFCLLRAAVALCGSAPVVAVPRFSKTGVIPEALKIIESIEFLDTPGKTPA
ncbi:hypothetical protein [Caballeronia sp. HLA56]